MRGGVWKLVESPVDYIHSSAKFYTTGEDGIYKSKMGIRLPFVTNLKAHLNRALP
jgi:hypothetical protein